jgi:hypothetical protein
VPTGELFTHERKHHDIVVGEGLVMTIAMNPPLRSPKQTPDRISGGRIEVVVAPYHKNVEDFL